MWEWKLLSRAYAVLNEYIFSTGKLVIQSNLILTPSVNWIVLSLILIRIFHVCFIWKWWVLPFCHVNDYAYILVCLSHTDIFFNFNFYFILLYSTVLVLPYIDINPPRVYMSSQSWTPLPLPLPYHLSGSSPCTSPKHPVSCIEPRLVIRFLHDSTHVSVPFSQIIPPSPSPSESKSPFYTSLSLLLSRIQGHHYHLSKFHIYVLVCCIGVFLSGLLHSV